jgi:CheY-like chemotaxis protein
MESKKLQRVLDVGNCGVDHAAIRRLLEGRFSAEVAQSHSQSEALAALRRESFDLVLVNRVFDRDGSDGLALIRTIKGDPALATIPVMLITNYPEHQRRAVEAGALPGFGKAELAAPETAERLAAVLDRPGGFQEC